jgi:hypothetical protein
MVGPKRGRGRPPAPNLQPGGKNQIPRSLGMVLRAIRRKRALDQDEMLELLNRTPSPYDLRKSRADRQNVNPGATVSEWETAAHNLDFSIQHRYGLVSRTYSGVLHIVSLAYANLRDHGDPIERDKRDVLKENLDLARGLMHLSQFISSRTQKHARDNAEPLHLAPLGDGGADEQHLQLINEMLDAFINGYEKS